MIAAEQERERREAAAAGRPRPQRAGRRRGGAAGTTATPAVASTGAAAGRSGRRRARTDAPRCPAAAATPPRRASRCSTSASPYVWGGASPCGFDCSGLASYAYAQIGKSVPHYTGRDLERVPQGAVATSSQPGDMVFFHGLGHMGIYIGGGQYVHAPHTGDVVKVASLGDRSDYVGAVRP